MDKVLKERFPEEVELTWGFEGWVSVGQIGRVGRAFQAEGTVSANSEVNNM